MAKTVDPSFQAAPYLGDSSHDPIEFARRQNAIKYQRKRERQDEIERNTAKGLDKLMIDLDGWNDKEGFREVMSRQQKAKDMYMELATKGVNFVNPTTEGEVMAYKALTDYQAKTKEMADLRNAQKVKIDVIEKLRAEEFKKPENQRFVDWDATQKNLTAGLNNNTLEGRDAILNTALVMKPTIGNVDKFVDDNKDYVTQVMVDPESGVPNANMERAQEEDLVKLFERMPEPELRALEAEKAKNTKYKVVPLKDYFVARYNRAASGKLTRALQEKDEGGGLNITLFGSQKAKAQPTARNDQKVRLGDRDYDEHYDFNIRTPFIGIPMSDLGADVLQGGKWEKVTDAGGLVSAQLNFYDPKTDSFIFTSTSDSQEAGVYRKQIFSVPRERLGDQAGDLPIIKDDGKAGKLKDIYGKQDPKTIGRGTVLKNSGITWK